MKLGHKIRELRKEQKLSMQELAQQAGVSVGLISQMERDLTTPSVETLWNVAKALRVHINYFFDEYEEKNPVIRRNERKQIVLPDSKVTYELLTSLEHKMEMMLVRIEPGLCGPEDMTTHEGEECGYVLQGTLKVKWGSKEYILHEGDSIYLDSSIPHRYINIGDTTSVSIWTMTPPSY